MEEIKAKLKSIIVNSLGLDDRDPDDLPDDQPLFESDLEIDSIDILQLITDIERTFKIKLVTGQFNRAVWENITTLAAEIENKISQGGPAE